MQARLLLPQIIDSTMKIQYITTDYADIVK